MASVTVTSPTSSSTWQANTSHNIAWTSSYVNENETPLSFSIYLYNGSSLDSTIATGLSTSTTSYTWTVPSGQTADTDYRILVRFYYDLIV